MAELDEHPQTLSYAGRQTLLPGRTWYAIVAGLILCVPGGFTLWFAATLSFQIFRHGMLLDGWGILVSVTAFMAVVTWPLAYLSYRALIKPSERHATMLWELALILTILLTIGSIVLFIQLKRLPTFHNWLELLFLGITASAWFAVLAMRKWAQVLGRAARQ